MTPNQSRAARALMGWTQSRAATTFGVGYSTIADFERGARQSFSIDRMRDGFIASGIEFIGCNGVIYHG